MKLFAKTVLYTALMLFANAAVADNAALEALREGDMRKLVFHSKPKTLPDVAFSDIDGNELSLADYQGKWVLLNFWATWCAPCRAEMPTLSNLETQLGGDDFTVLTIATGRNPPPAIKRFFTEASIENLPTHIDPRQALSRPMAVLGLPVTIVINPEGQEIARLTGDAVWDDENAVTLIKAMISSEE